MARLSSESRGYIQGNAGSRETSSMNLAAFRRWSLVPKRLMPSRKDENGQELFTDLSTKVLGQELPFPIALAPVGVQKIFHAMGEVAAARGAADSGVPASMEDVAAANKTTEGQGGLQWYQLYWPANKHNDITVSLLTRAKKAGYTALFVTLDTDSVFQEHFKKEHGAGIYEKNPGGKLGEDMQSKAAREWTHVVFPGHTHGWEDIKFLQSHWDGPIVLKGIQSVVDAQKAVEAGVQGIVVSNHGGRQQNGGNSSLDVLPQIVDAVDEKLDVFFDRCGADIAKAPVLGAKCVLIGRPYTYGLILSSEEGVKHVVKSLCGELEVNLHPAGIRGLDELDRECLVKEDDLF